MVTDSSGLLISCEKLAARRATQQVFRLCEVLLRPQPGGDKVSHLILTEPAAQRCLDGADQGIRLYGTFQQHLISKGFSSQCFPPASTLTAPAMVSRIRGRSDQEGCSEICAAHRAMSGKVSIFRQNDGALPRRSIPFEPFPRLPERRANAVGRKKVGSARHRVRWEQLPARGARFPDRHGAAA